MKRRSGSLQDQLERLGMPEPNSGCTLFMGAPRKLGGYGQISVAGRRSPQPAHRVAYEVFVGPIPEGLHVLHDCDNPPCINPSHLRVGTVQDNADDKVERHRQRPSLTLRSSAASKSVSISGKRITTTLVLDRAQFDWLAEQSVTTGLNRSEIARSVFDAAITATKVV